MSEWPCLRMQRHGLLSKTKRVRALLDIYREEFFCSLATRLTPRHPTVAGHQEEHTDRKALSAMLSSQMKGNLKVKLA